MKVSPFPPSTATHATFCRPAQQQKQIIRIYNVKKKRSHWPIQPFTIRKINLSALALLLILQSLNIQCSNNAGELGKSGSTVKTSRLLLMSRPVVNRIYLLPPSEARLWGRGLFTTHLVYHPKHLPTIKPWWKFFPFKLSSSPKLTYLFLNTSNYGGSTSYFLEENFSIWKKYKKVIWEEIFKSEKNL